MKFSEIPYERPDVEAFKRGIAAFTSAFRAAGSYAEAKEIFVAKELKDRHIQTLGTVAHIRHTINTKDAFYEGEEKFWNSAAPEIQEQEQEWTLALLQSPFRDDFAREYGEIMFTNAEIELKTFSPEIIPMLQKENDLVTEYEALLAGAQIPFEDGVYTIAQIASFKNDADDDRRLAAWKAEGKWYKDNGAKLDRLYDELVRLRDEMGKKLGYGGYTQLGYYRMCRNCYTKEDIGKFRSAVQKYLVPVAEGIFREQAKRLGKEYPMSFADAALLFRSGNAKPAGDEKAIVAAAKKFYDELSPQTSKFFRIMLDGELMDLLSTEGKAGGGYCTDLPDYGVPFIFANFNGTRDDVETVTHEAGHAFAFWLNAERIPFSMTAPTMEACEVHSMSMEFFSWPWAELFFGDDTRKFRYSHLAGALTFIPYGTLVDHFQHLVFENPSWTPRERHNAWKELLGVYMPWMRLDGDIPFYSEGEGWQRQHHIYSFPFYYIDYCLAQTVALEFWAKLQKDLPAAWERYMAYTVPGGSKTFTELLEGAGLDSPFDEKCLRGVCEAANDWLRSYDLTGIE